MGRDFAAVFALGLALAVFGLSGSALKMAFINLIRHATSTLTSLPTRVEPPPVLAHATGPVIGHMILLLFAVGVGGSAAMLMQTRGQIWMKKLAPDPKRILQIDRLTRMFKREFFVDILMSAVKVLALCTAVTLAVGSSYKQLPRLLGLPFAELFGHLTTPLLKGAAAVLIVMGVLATLDYVVQHFRFIEKAKMTKQQVKDERKEEEGDPLIKGMRRRKHREMSQGRVEKDVPEADAIIVNPTHIAIAIRYRKDEGGAPKVTCKGKDARADKMRALAREHNIPIYKDIPLARLLHKKVKVGQEVPAETYKAVAAVLTFVYRVTGRRPGQANR